MQIPSARSRRARLLALSVIATVCGCSSQGETFFPVSGKVRVNGKPLPIGAVSFRPDVSRGNECLHHPTGEIDADGHYELFTLGQPGAPPGWYKVLVFADENQKGGEIHPLMPRWATHIKYTSEQLTDLFVEVVETPVPGTYDLELSK
jgi:hypothetical protein